ncbi:DNA repair protein RecN [Acidiferrobacter sp.]|uniref:DNA repair protein RecN n=1 Tax=Acidiferrobacter sp. TaxID=1872107 RepID=UPI00262E6DC1|nr:DNA repair protein RecN [Acidiferrobacter sp.]
MLSELLIRSFVVIDELRIPLGPGLSVVTGETGAGKSVLVDALGLVLGSRADAGAIRTGADAAEVIATFDLAPDSPARAWLRERDLTADADQCIVRRIVAPDRSRAFINATPVPLQMLRDLSEQLLDLHGQHEHQALMRKDMQRTLLDAYAGAEGEAQALAEAMAALQSARSRHNALQEAAEQRAARASLVRYQLDELEALRPETGEWQGLNAAERRLAHAQELTSGISTLITALSEGEEALSLQIERALSALRPLARHEPRLAEVEGLLASAGVEIGEAAIALNRIAAGVESEPLDLPALESRVSRWHELARKHRVPPEELPGLWTQLATEHESLQGDGEAIAGLAREIAGREDEALAIAEALSTKRAASAPTLARAVTEEMGRLGLGSARLQVALTPEELSAHGREGIEFLVSPAPDAPFKPLAKIASGGELSRISLALQVVLADVCAGPTLVFDEVDVGIGGAVAEIVGLRLHELSRTRQVLCITHLPQVAAQGDTHLLVEKGQTGGRTISSVEVLTQKRRIEEIARMLGGIAVSERTRALARDMLRG